MNNESTDSRVVVHMAASLDGFIARKDGTVDWMETSDTYPNGVELDSKAIQDFLQTIECYVMGSKTYETALQFATQGFGWVYGEKPVFVLTNRTLPNTRDTVRFYSGDLADLIGELRSRYRSIWVAGGSNIASECLQRKLADEIRYSILPIAIGNGMSFFSQLTKDIPLHLVDVKAYKSGTVELCYEVRDLD